MRTFRIAMAIGLVLCAAPLLATVAAGLTASHFGCTLHEGFVNPCVIGGTDYGETLYTMGMMGWLMLFTLPIAAVIVVAWMVAEIAGVFRRRRQT